MRSPFSSTSSCPPSSDLGARVATAGCRRHAWVCATLLAALLSACGYYHYAGPLRPLATQAEPMAEGEDGTVFFDDGQVRISLRPMTAAELNQLYPDHSRSEEKSTNPYTFGDTRFWRPGQRDDRFTVFRLQVRNTGYPKMKIDPARIALRTPQGREYWSLNRDQLDSYFRTHVIGYQGNEYSRYQERRDLLRRTLYPNEEIFAGQEKDGFVVFPLLHPHVRRVDAVVADVVLRFDYRGEPVEARTLTFQFERDIGRLYTDGEVELAGQR